MTSNHAIEYIYTNKNSILPELCDELICMYNEQTTNKYEGITAGGLNKNIKDTKDYVIEKNDPKWSRIHSFLEKELYRNLQKYTKKINNIENHEGYLNTGQKSTIAEYKMFDGQRFILKNYMMQRYEKNVGKYIYHHDFQVDYDAKQHRAITYLWYLNDVDEGGETEFWGNYKIKPRKGTLILFPASWTFPHCGKMPISNDKYIITGWVYINE